MLEKFHLDQNRKAIFEDFEATFTFDQDPFKNLKKDQDFVLNF